MNDSQKMANDFLKKKIVMPYEDSYVLETSIFQQIYIYEGNKKKFCKEFGKIIAVFFSDLDSKSFTLYFNAMIIMYQEYKEIFHIENKDPNLEKILKNFIESIKRNGESLND